MKKLNLCMKRIIMVIVTFGLICSFIPISANTKAETDTDDKIIVNIEGETITYTVDRSEKAISVIGRNEYNQNIVHIFIKDDIIYKQVGNEFTEIGRIEEITKIQSEHSNILRYIEPNWGPLLTVTKKVTFGNPVSMGLADIVAALIGQMGFAGKFAAGLLKVATEIQKGNIKTVYETEQYHEAIGCPKYIWLKKYILKDTKGKILKSENLDRKVFTGVTHSPENPPACTAYGF